MSKKEIGTKISGKVDAKAIVAKEGYPEVGRFADEKSLQKFYKQLDNPTLEDWCAVEGLTYKPCPESEPIHRMRVAMAILNKHFPKQSAPKQESPYKKYTTEDLVKLALEQNVLFETSDDDRITRMRAIMALRAHKVIE